MILWGWEFGAENMGIRCGKYGNFVRKIWELCAEKWEFGAEKWEFGAENRG